jgi:hypothetical protein
MMTYKLIKDIDSEKIGCILRSDGVAIPLDEANTDYQEYLKWIEAGNTPLPADE